MQYFHTRPYRRTPQFAIKAEVICTYVWPSHLPISPNLLFLINILSQDVSRILRSSSTPTAIYMSMNHHGNVLYGISCVEQIIKEISPDYVRFDHFRGVLSGIQVGCELSDDDKLQKKNSDVLSL